MLFSHEGRSDFDSVYNIIEERSYESFLPSRQELIRLRS